jgi:hypothetical protein
MHRTQLYLEEDLWAALRVRSRESGLSVSELVRQAVRERYFGDLAKRQAAMKAFVGIRKDRSDIGDSETYIRRLRKGTRLRRVME